MKNKLIILLFIAISGLVFSVFYFLNNKDKWVCQANIWNPIGNPKGGVPSELCDGLATIYVDVRENEEWYSGHIKGAVHLSLSQIQNGELLNIPNNSYIGFYCKSGNRAEIAKQLFINAGFQNSFNAGGIENLVSKGFPIE